MSREGLDRLLSEVIIQLKEIEEREQEKIDKLESDEFVYIKFESEEDEVHIENPAPGTFILSGKYVEYWANRIPLTSQENLHRIYKKFQNKGIIERLKKGGMREGDTFSVKGTMFTMMYE